MRVLIQLDITIMILVDNGSRNSDSVIPSLSKHQQTTVVTIRRLFFKKQMSN